MSDAHPSAPQRRVQLRPSAGIARGKPVGARGQDRQGARRERRGQDHTLKTISGIIDPRKGQVKYKRRGHQGNSPDTIVRAGIVHVPEGREVFPLFWVEDNLRMGAYTRSNSDGVAQDLEAVFGYFPILRERARQEAGQLSGGQQQMLAIARALLGRPSLMLMDEPSLGLSPKLTKEIFDIVVRINRERGVTILLVEQNAHMALEDRGFRLCARSRAHRDGGYRRAVGREGRHQGILPRHEGRGCERSTTVETQETLAMTKGEGRRHPAENVLAGRRGAWRAGELRQKHFGIWQSVCWTEFGQIAREIGMGLVALGFEPGECASVLSNTNREWLYADMGILGARWRVERRLSDRRAGAGRIPVRGFEHRLSVRRG